MAFDQMVISPLLHKRYPHYWIPLPHTSTWERIEAQHPDMPTHTYILVRRDYDQDGSTWIVRDYLLIKANHPVFGTWIRMRTAYMVSEQPIMRNYMVHMVEPIRFSQNTCCVPVPYTVQDAKRMLESVLMQTGAFDQPKRPPGF